MADQFRGYTVGQQVWIKSLKDTGVVAGWIEGRGEVLVLTAEHMHVAKGYFTNQIEPVARDVFPVGTRVETPHYFKGVVTGYEDATNRVVCYSDKTNEYTDNIDPGDADRIRYSYNVSGIHKIQELHLEAGQHYLLATTKGKQVRALVTSHLQSRSAVMLVGIDKGNIIAVFPDPCITVRDMRNKGISSMEQDVLVYL